MIIYVKNEFEQMVAEIFQKYNKDMDIGADIEIKQYFEELDYDTKQSFPVQGAVVH